MLHNNGIAIACVQMKQFRGPCRKSLFDASANCWEKKKRGGNVNSTRIDGCKILDTDSSIRPPHETQQQAIPASSFRCPISRPVLAMKSQLASPIMSL
jgi:hypothetical protein